MLYLKNLYLFVRFVLILFVKSDLIREIRVYEESLGSPRNNG
ncbi:MAG: hypothetical protein JWR38_1522 [Mucilaginibacter sp.]|nr:hypothetical protein [Mucilaginibacter sp.]